MWISFSPNNFQWHWVHINKHHCLSNLFKGLNFIVSIIFVRFIIDQHPFLREVLTWVDNNTFFQQHFTTTCNFLPPLVCMCFFFSVWTIHQIIDGSTLRFHLETFAPSYHFQHIFWQNIWTPLFLNLIMF
jgi:hypothetical protein